MPMTEIKLHFVHRGESLDLKGCQLDFEMHLLYSSERCIRGQEEHASSYIDDNLLYNLTWEQHLAHIKAVLEALS